METELLNALSYRIIGAGIEVHRALGPGLLESTYRACMVYELHERRMNVVTEQSIPIRYKGLTMDGSYRIDLIVEDIIVVEMKSVEAFAPVHRAQVLSYLRHTNRPLGLLINFNVAVLTSGIERIRNGY